MRVFTNSLWDFGICYFPTPRPTLGHYWGEILAYPMLITAIFDLKVEYLRPCHRNSCCLRILKSLLFCIKLLNESIKTRFLKSVFCYSQKIWTPFFHTPKGKRNKCKRNKLDVHVRNAQYINRFKSRLIEAFTVFIKPFEAPQRSVKIKI